MTNEIGTPFYWPCVSIYFRASIPFNTIPNTTCLPSRWGVGAVVIKNYEPFVLGPEFAIESTPTSCKIEKFSSLNFSP